MTGPILITCEGSGQPGHVYEPGEAMCAMCGQFMPADGDIVRSHQRDDILTRIARGDFG